MSETIKDGLTGDSAHVDKNFQFHTFSVTESETSQAAEEGNGYNLNTGLIAITGTVDHAVAYFKNDEDEDFIITAVAWYIGTRTASITDSTILTIIRNPTTGSIFDATPVNGDMKSNNNFGSNKSLKDTSLFYKGVSTDTFTDGTEHALLGAGEGRSFANLDIEMPKGSSIGITIDPNTSGACSVYVALIGHLKDPKNK